jgi:organic hydroperoxide reductase OsmC/OhrA
MTDGSRVHRYATTCVWTGSTGVGYADYPRAHEVAAAPVDGALRMSSDPAFGGDAARMNPEQLLVAAASSCQLLSFLAVAARARVDVVDYRDEATGVMPEHPGPAPSWVERIVLRPTISVRGDRPTDDRLRRLVDLGHRECFVARSLRTTIEVEPSFVRV